MTMRRVELGTFSQPSITNAYTQSGVRERMKFSAILNPTNIEYSANDARQPLSEGTANPKNLPLLPLPKELDVRNMIASNFWSTSVTQCPLPLPEVTTTVEASTVEFLKLPSIVSFHPSGPLDDNQEEWHDGAKISLGRLDSSPLLDLRMESQRKPSKRLSHTQDSSWPSPKRRQQRVTPPLSPEAASQRGAANHCNQPYLREHLHCVRYLKEDLHLPWGVVYRQFNHIFRHQPGFIERESEAALTSRSYRDNFTYASVNGEPLLSSNGAPIRVKAKVRRRLVAEERHIPFKLVEKHPSWAVTYSWVRPEHKAQAQAILDAVDPLYYHSGRSSVSLFQNSDGH
ncbi:hypothetical protein BGHDH14_bgh02921 [Blumeria hordei DH14]|uniref:Uncharacterized protein n=1 Tax=Blumeria graminis f. sp. hordei (strain DH14) TaxID=546991 RepID=N1JM21_BLUG1|nr:hypothetical protein BGHDH14_bgh02921 [Blumeria hordei DH14]